MNPSTQPEQDEHIFTISELNRMAHGLLENHFQTIWIEGEISNFVAPRSGHWYFSLKDENAQVRCAMFRIHNLRIKFEPEDGMHVLAHAKVSLYEPRGDYQLVVDQIEEMGVGELQRAFEQLKKKLDKAGLFDAEYKKEIPEFPNCIGVITSATGAAIRDILNVLKRRFPALPVIIYPTLVQGDTAAPTIVKAIEIANQRDECDLLILARGGGSLEDLWPFNEEIVAYAIFRSKLPIVTGIGHEIDFTIADFVADLRAPTPSAAAELVSPDCNELKAQLKQYQQSLRQQIVQTIKSYLTDCVNLKKRLLQCHPQKQIEQQMQQCDQLERTLIKAQKQIVQNHQQQLKLLVRALNAVNPLGILERGYSVVKNAQDKIITRRKQVTIGEKITTQLADGKIVSIVEE